MSCKSSFRILASLTAVLLVFLVSTYLVLELTGIGPSYRLKRVAEYHFQVRVDHKIKAIDYLVQAYFRDKQSFPNNLDEVWTRLEMDEKEIAVWCRDIRGNQVNYRYPPLHNKEKPDIWIEDSQSGRVMSNW